MIFILSCYYFIFNITCIVWVQTSLTHSWISGGAWAEECWTFLLTRFKIISINVFPSSYIFWVFCRMQDHRYPPHALLHLVISSTDAGQAIQRNDHSLMRSFRFWKVMQSPLKRIRNFSQLINLMEVILFWDAYQNVLLGIIDLLLLNLRCLLKWCVMLIVPYSLHV